MYIYSDLFAWTRPGLDLIESMGEAQDGRRRGLNSMFHLPSSPLWIAVPTLIVVQNYTTMESNRVCMSEMIEKQQQQNIASF
jgi:predicted transposase YdaD